MENIQTQENYYGIQLIEAFTAAIASYTPDTFEDNKNKYNEPYLNEPATHSKYNLHNYSDEPATHSKYQLNNYSDDHDNSNVHAPGVSNKYSTDDEMDTMDTMESDKLLPDTKMNSWKNRAPIHYSLYRGNESRIVLTTTHISNLDDLNLLKSFAQCLGITIDLNWSSKTTHTVVGTNNEGKCRKHSKKMLYAILSNNFIVNMNWIKDCIDSKCLLTEHYYMPTDEENESTFVTSMRVKLGMIDNPLSWIKHCVIYVYELYGKTSWQSDILKWMEIYGCTLIKSVSEFSKYSNKLRIVLVDVDKEEYNTIRFPRPTTISYWFCQFEAITIFMEWTRLCLVNYRYVDLDPYRVCSSSSVNDID